MTEGPAITIEDGTIQAISIRAPRTNAEGDEVESAKVLVTFKFDIDRAGAHLNALGRLIKRDRVIKRIGLSFVEQLELPKLVAHDDRPRLNDPLGSMPTAAKNGHDAKKAHDVVVSAKAAGGELVTSGTQKKRGT